MDTAMIRRMEENRRRYYNNMRQDSTRQFGPQFMPGGPVPGPGPLGRGMMPGQTFSVPGRNNNK